MNRKQNKEQALQVARSSILQSGKFAPYFTFEVFPSYGKKGERYCSVFLSGDCLSHIGINDGDSAIVHMTKEVPHNALAVVVTRQSPLVKFIHYERDGRVCLYTGAPDFVPMYFKESDVRIIGQIVRIERNLTKLRQPKGGAQ